MAAGKGGTILIVEDDPGVATLERRRLERAGYAVVTAAAAAEALQQLDRHVIDLLLLDYRLPDSVDGLAFHAQLKAAGHDLPVILVTGFSNEATVIQALRAGVRDFVTKSAAYLDYLPEAVARVLRQVRTEAQLTESEARLAAVIGSAKDAILLAGADQRITLFNAAAEQMFRCPAAQALGQPLSRFIPTELPPPPPAANGAAAEARAARTSDLRFGSRGVRADGDEFPLETSVSSVQVAGGTFWTVVVREVTERIRLEEQLRQAQKMEAIGHLAGGVAHDFNNLLTIITGYSEMVLNGLHSDDPAHDLLGEVRKAAERAAALTRQLLAFSRKQVLQPVVLDLNALVQETEKMLRRLIGEDIDLEARLDPVLGRVQADPGQLEQVLLNLAVNARDAMPQGGQLTLETANVEWDGGSPSPPLPGRPGGYVLLTVRDTGCGMDAATRARIFEPFFTTKGPGKGTGLGLATVYGIVQQSGGHIEVSSAPGRGTAFQIYLPCVAEAARAGGAAGHPFTVPRGTETVLLAEDQDEVRALAALALRARGYTVLEARDGEEALQVCRQHPAPIALLVSDVVMPRLSGRRLAELAVAARPDLKVLYLSGYTDDAVVRHGVLEAGVAFLHKPFTPASLARKVREVLEW